jgi:hypothetical protein
MTIVNENCLENHLKKASEESLKNVWKIVWIMILIKIFQMIRKLSEFKYYLVFK